MKNGTRDDDPLSEKGADLQGIPQGDRRWSPLIHVRDEGELSSVQRDLIHALSSEPRFIVLPGSRGDDNPTLVEKTQMSRIQPLSRREGETR